MPPIKSWFNRRSDLGHVGFLYCLILKEKPARQLSLAGLFEGWITLGESIRSL